MNLFRLLNQDLHLFWLKVGLAVKVPNLGLFNKDAVQINVTTSLDIFLKLEILIDKESCFASNPIIYDKAFWINYHFIDVG